MSVVINVCGDNFSMMISDGRVIQFDENGDTRIVLENYKKFKKVKDDVIVGFAGDPEPTLKAFDVLSKYDMDELSLIEIKNILVNTIQMQPINKLGVKLIVSGKNCFGKYVSYSIDSRQNFKEEFFEPKGNMYALIYAVPQAENDTDDYAKIIDDAYKNHKYKTSNELIQNLGKGIYKISKLNKSVNNIISYEIIH